MTLRVRYNRITTPAGTEPDTVTVRAGTSFSSAAEEGAVAISQIIVDDPTNALDYVGRRRLYAYETACQAHNQMVYNGYIQNRTLGRQPVEGQDNDEEVLGRRWALNVSDTNSLLSRRLITGADGDRPAETDIARIQWLLDSNDAYLSNPQDTWANPSPYVNTTGPISMSKADYRGRPAFDVLNDCAQRSGKNWYARYYEANDTVPPTNGGSIALWYDFDTSSALTSTLRLTNVRADVDNITTFAVMPDALLSRDPTRAYSGVYLTYDGGARYDQSTNVVNLFQRQDAAVSNPYVKTDTEAGTLNARYLTDAATEDDRLTCEFTVAKQYVNDLREGDRFEGKFSHFATASGSDYSRWQWWRCLRRTVTHLNDEFYRLNIEASPSGVISPSGYVYAATHARLMREGSHGIPAGSGEYEITWERDGDNPQGGDASDPLTGRVSYAPNYTDGGAPLGVYHRGLTVSGAGTITWQVKASANTVVSGAGSTTWSIRKNGVSIGNSTSAHGTGFVTSSCDFSGSTTVVSGDVLSVHFSDNGMGDGWTIPAAPGAGDHRLLIDGSLGA